MMPRYYPIVDDTDAIKVLILAVSVGTNERDEKNRLLCRCLLASVHVWLALLGVKGV